MSIPRLNRCDTARSHSRRKEQPFKSFFNPTFNGYKYSDEVSFCRHDRKPQSQISWQGTAQDKDRHHKQVRQRASDATNKIYSMALENYVHGRKGPQNTARNLLESKAAQQESALEDLHLQISSATSIGHSQDLDSTRFCGYGWIGGLVVILELRHRVAALRKMLELPPCNSTANFDELIASTTEALQELDPVRVTSKLPLAMSNRRMELVFQNLQRFYQTICRMENVWVDSFSQKDEERTSKCFDGQDHGRTKQNQSFVYLGRENLYPIVQTISPFGCSSRSIKPGSRSQKRRHTKHSSEKDEFTTFENLLQETRQMHHQTSSRGREKSLPSVPIIYSFGCSMRRASKSANKRRKPGHIKQNSEEASTFEKSMQGAQRMEEDFLSQRTVEIVSPYGCSCKRRSKTVSNTRKKKHTHQYSEDSSTIEQLSHKILKKLDDFNKQIKASGHSLGNIQGFDSRLLQFPSSIIGKSYCKVKPYLTPNSSSVLSEVEGATSPTSASGNYMTIGIPSSIQLPASLSLDKNTHSVSEKQVTLDHPRAVLCVQGKTDGDKSETTNQGNIQSTPPSLKVVNGINQVKHFDIQSENASEGLDSFFTSMFTMQGKQPLEAKVGRQINSNLSILDRKTGTVISPPPPPTVGIMPLRSTKTTKLKRSPAIRKLYMDVKRKVEGAPMGERVPFNQMTLGRGGGREGMAEALAEITKKSAYFRKIEEDVQQHASSVLEVKSELEAFGTDNMETLLKFHQRLESRLELLSDESQVLAHFEGFPNKKLDTVRMAASLYSRLRSLAQQIENWCVEPPASDQVDKITTFFDQMKVKIEAIDRTKDEDAKHFTTQNIHFSFDMVIRVKEAMVDLSSSLSALALKESNKTKASADIKGECKDMTYRLRVTFQILWKAFQLSFRVYVFAGGLDEQAEKLTFDLAKEMETYPDQFWCTTK
eukprot:c21500_g1_i2 orf=419-3229(+)